MPPRISLPFVLALLLAPAHAFYLPGIAMQEYADGDVVEVLANKLTSPSNTLPYGYYSLPFCATPGSLKSRPVNLGQLLSGERAFPTPYTINMMHPVSCRVVCTVALATLQERPYKGLLNRIKENYSARLNADNMPLVTRYTTSAGHRAFKFGYKLGFTVANDVFINNHVRLTIRYHQPSLSAGEAIDALTANKDAFRIVGFEVEPFSLNHAPDPAGVLPEGACKPSDRPQFQRVARDQNITFTYDVNFQSSDLAWATRWDPILDANADIKKIQWVSIVNSLMVSLFLTALVATVMLRTVLRDFGRYNAVVEDEDEDDHTGWKYIHADVFRPPKLAPFLSICVGSGAQVLVMALATQLFALIGFLSPANRGGLLTALITLWVLASFVSGYVSSRLYIRIDTGVSRRLVTFGTALLFPGITFSIFFALNLSMWWVGSSGSVPFTTLLLILFAWFGISVPLVFIGSQSGYRTKRYDFPTRTNQIQRQIPDPPFGVSPYIYAVLAGVLPFGTVFMELVFILNSMWTGSVYYLYGALLSVFLILVLTCAEMSIVSTYLSLSAEDWKSHWHTSFWGPASAGLYVFLYSLYFALAQRSDVPIPFVSIVVFVCWSLVVSGAFSLMCGTVGFVSSFWFTGKIYSSIRID
ncbi:unnamed protein product [Chondrus crispus]|uniref:Transmembrane 9 superfamily member n=1 Tax=Chondrus crispus TaxID=2769 RepID=R7Q9U3_CHOCR|nr:unnamed protein product [Chondrus crispus]CDF34245.1 unnamed protein product [Chondrus crispus]|eukprot:XP_005714064.1 unnamed protein product [Chondrus crispus]